MLYKVVLTFESVDEILKCDCSKESYRAVLSCGAVSYAVQGASSIWVSGRNQRGGPFKWKLLSSTFLWCCCFFMLYKVVLTFESVDEILKCDHPIESFSAVLSCGAFYYAVQSGSNVWVCGRNPKVWSFKWKLLSSTFLWCCSLCCIRRF